MGPEQPWCDGHRVTGWGVPTWGSFLLLQESHLLKRDKGVPVMAHRVKNPTSIHEDAGSIPGLLNGLRIWCCHSCSALGSGVAMDVVEAGNSRSDSIP